MRHSAILAGADIAPNVKSELIDYADLKGLTLLYDNIFSTWSRNPRAWCTRACFV